MLGTKIALAIVGNKIDLDKNINVPLNMAERYLCVLLLKIYFIEID